jgi:hypothetical protein
LQPPPDEPFDERGGDGARMDPESQLGRIFAVPDAWWGFEAAGREDHPGACVQERPKTREWILLKGTAADGRAKYYKTEVLIVPSDTNGLLKNTLFSLKPRPFRSHKLKNLVPSRVMGHLSEVDLQRLLGEMIRQFGLQG